MDRQYEHLDYEERGVIFSEHRRGSSLRQIGRLLGRHASTIGRELGRGATPTGYDPQVARQAHDVARRRCGRRRKLVPDAAFYLWVRDRLIHWRWSPEQIAARSRPDCGACILTISASASAMRRSMPRSTRSRRAG